MPDQAEIREKERRVREFLDSKGLKGLLLKRQANFSWITCGGLNLVGITTELGATSLLLLRDAKYLISNNIEAPRMMEEEALSEQGFQLQSFQWHQDKEEEIVRELSEGGPLASDVPFPGAQVLPQEVARLRYSLTPQEVQRYKWLGRKVSECLERVLREARPGQKECQVVGKLSQELWSERIDCVTLMGAADQRVFRFRHPIPTERPIEKYFMLSVNARKWGLIVSLTRFVHFGRVPQDLKARYLANVEIDCRFMAATRPGVEAREVLSKGIEAYREKGYPQEWQLHHQGGAIGYTGRDYRTNFQTMEVIQENQPFTWNPSITGTKSEDTIMATSQGVLMITHPVSYPVLELQVEGVTFVRPDILEI